MKEQKRNRPTKPKKKMHRYVVGSYTMAEYLYKHGCKLVKTEPDKFDPRSKIYIFERNEHFEKVLGEYHIMVRQNNYFR